MTKIILLLIGIFLIVAAMTGFEFSTRPLHFKFRDNYLAIGITLLVAAAFFIYYSGTRQN